MPVQTHLNFYCSGPIIVTAGDTVYRPATRVDLQQAAEAADRCFIVAVDASRLSEQIIEELAEAIVVNRLAGEIVEYTQGESTESRTQCVSDFIVWTATPRPLWGTLYLVRLGRLVG